MRQPKRWGDSGSEATRFEQELVLAGQAVRMPDAQRQALWSSIASRIPVAGNAPSGDGGGPTPSAAGGAAAAAAAAMPALKVLVVVAVVGGGVGSALWAMHGHGVTDETARRPGIVSTTGPTTQPNGEVLPVHANDELRPSEKTVTRPRSAGVGDPAALAASGVASADDAVPAAVGAELVEPAVQGAGTTVLSPMAEPGSRVSEVDAPRSASRLQEESDTLLAAREAYRAGNSARALQLLDRARRRFPRGTLGQEREALTIQVLAQSGERGAAKQRAEAFLRRYPRSPHAADVRGIAER